MKVWTVSTVNFQIAGDSVACGDAEDFAPYGVYMTRDKATDAVVTEMNAVRKDDEDDETVTADGLKWEDVHVQNGHLLRWRTFDEYDETGYVITELELDS